MSRSTARRNFASTPPTSRQPPTRSKLPTCSLAFSPPSTRDKTAQWKKQGGNDYSLLRNCEWSEKQKHKKQPWGNVECFAFGGVTVHFAPLETSFHAANHTIPPPPSYEGYPLCPKDKNLSPFHGEKPLMITWFLGKKPHQISQKMSIS